jgi:hypothetical protein
MTDEPRRAPGFLREGYKRSTRTWRVDAPPEKVVSTQTEHWDGSLDAKVRPAAIVMKCHMELDRGERVVAPNE